MSSDATLLSRHRAGSLVAFTRDREVRAEELCAHVAAVADLLPEAGGAEEIVVVCRDRHRFAVALLAAWRRGFAVALPPSSQLDAIAEVRRRPGVRTVVHDVDGVDRGIDVRSAPVVAAARARVGNVALAAFGPYERDRKLATVYTSGSTGATVACPKTAGQLIGEATLLASTFGIGEGARIVPMVPPHHIYGLLFGVLVPLVGGGAYARQTPLYAGEVALAARDADVIVSVPAHLRGLLGGEPDALPSVPRVFSSGAPLSPGVAEQVKLRFGWTITEVFGSSETGGIAWRDTGGRGTWRPLPGVIVGEGSDGTLLLESPFLHPSQAQPHACADRVQVLEDGTFFHLGRADGVLKVGGVRVSLAEIEERLLSIEGVRDAAAMGVSVEGARGTEVWVAVVAPGLGVRSIRDALLRWLAPVAVPRRIKIVDALPREANGKLPRASLEALFARSPR